TSGGLMDPNRNNEKTELSKVDSEKSEDGEEFETSEKVAAFELTWEEDQVTGVQIQVGADAPHDAVQGELLICGGMFTISWQDPAEPIEDMLPVPVSPAPSQPTTSGAAKVNKKELTEQKAREQWTADKR